MKYSFLSVLALVMAFASTAPALEIGKPVPDFHVKDVEGQPESISQYQGKIVVLEWTNPGCPFVHKHYDSNNMQNLQLYARGKGVVWLSINSSAIDKEGSLDADGAKASIAKNKAHATGYILDPEGMIGHAYDAKTTPHMFVIAKDGTLAYEGAIDDKPTPDAADIATANNYVKAAIDALMAGKPVETTVTRSYGCSVKY